MTDTDDARKRYAEYIKLHLFDERYLSREREKKILGEGVTRFEISLEEARSILMNVAAEQDFIFEKDVDKLVKEIMQAFAASDGHIGQSEFRHAVHIYKQLSSGHVGEGDAKRRLKQMMIENDWKPRRQSFIVMANLGSRKWFRDIPEK
ncbi:MAG: hypothetical protein GC168_18745 [Candidatus Hydrogenedens sp.]|nr:hypothetical protein [Candidatus Hydrogenedens sp.]